MFNFLFSIPVAQTVADAIDNTSVIGLITREYTVNAT